jgi:hypothetical protein
MIFVLQVYLWWQTDSWSTHSWALNALLLVWRKEYGIIKQNEEDKGKGKKKSVRESSEKVRSKLCNILTDFSIPFQVFEIAFSTETQ